MYILTILWKNLDRLHYATLLPLGSTVISDHLRVGKLQTYCGLQSGTLPVSIPINFKSYAKPKEGVVGLQLGLLSCIF